MVILLFLLKAYSTSAKKSQIKPRQTVLRVGSNAGFLSSFLTSDDYTKFISMHDTILL